METFELAHCPSHQRDVDVIQNGVEGGPAESTVVVDPSRDDWIQPTGEVVEAVLRARCERPLPPYVLPEVAGCLRTDRRTEAHEEFSTAISRRARPKPIPQEVEALARPVPSATRILTVHDPSLVRMEFELAELQAVLDSLPDPFQLFRDRQCTTISSAYRSKWMARQVSFIHWSKPRCRKMFAKSGLITPP